MHAHGAKPDQVRLAAIDMSAAYQKGLREHLPKAEIVFDRFHVMQLAGKAIDEVRKQLQLRHDICARHKELGRAMALRESLQDTWQWPSATGAELHLPAWCSWAMRSRLAGVHAGWSASVSETTCLNSLRLVSRFVAISASGRPRLCRRGYKRAFADAATGGGRTGARLAQRGQTLVN